MIVPKNKDKKRKTRRKGLRGMRRSFAVSSSKGATPDVGGRKKRGRRMNRRRRRRRRRGGALPPGLAKRENSPPGLTNKIAAASQETPRGRPVTQKIAKASKPHKGEVIARRMQRMKNKDKGQSFGAPSYGRPMRGPRKKDLLARLPANRATPLTTNRPVVRNDAIRRRYSRNYR